MYTRIATHVVSPRRTSPGKGEGSTLALQRGKKQLLGTANNFQGARVYSYCRKVFTRVFTTTGSGVFDKRTNTKGGRQQKGGREGCSNEHGAEKENVLLWKAVCLAKSAPTQKERESKRLKGCRK